MRKSPYIQSVDKALTIMDLFMNHEQLGITEISSNLNMDKAVVYKLVITLEKHGYLRQLADNKKYRIGPKAYQIGNRYLSRSDNITHLIQSCYPVLRDLMEKTKCTSQLGIIERADLEAIIIASVESDSVIKVSASQGERMPILASAAGKCILAFSEEDLLQRVLAKPLIPLTPKTINDKESVIKELEQVRSQGFAISDEEWATGVFAIAAPVFDFRNHCIAALLISFPIYEKEEKFKNLTQIICTTAQEFSQTLGFH